MLVRPLLGVVVSCDLPDDVTALVWSRFIR